MNIHVIYGVLMDIDNCGELILIIIQHMGHLQC